MSLGTGLPSVDTKRVVVPVQLTRGRRLSRVSQSRGTHLPRSPDNFVKPILVVSPLTVEPYGTWKNKIFNTVSWIPSSVQTGGTLNNSDPITDVEVLRLLLCLFVRRSSCKSFHRTLPHTPWDRGWSTLLNPIIYRTSESKRHVLPCIRETKKTEGPS